MAFRKTSYSKVFVDDAIPSFLVQREASIADSMPAVQSNVLQVSPSLIKSSMTTTPPPASAEPAPLPQSERRNRSLQLRPAFMLRVIGTTIALNTALHLLLTALPSLLPVTPAPITGLQAQAAPDASTAPPLIAQQSSEVITYQSAAPETPRLIEVSGE